MRIALISDVHANLPALQAVLAGRDGITATYHLGDLVGYAPWPDETVALLRDAEISGVAGNYDSTVRGRRPRDRRCGRLGPRVRCATRPRARPIPNRIKYCYIGGVAATEGGVQ